MRRIFSIFFILAIGFSLAACGESGPKKAVKETQAQKAAKAAESISFVENAEIDNIKKRLELTSDPGLQGWTTLINDMGQVVLYTAVDGKITSSGKRLTNPVKPHRIDTGQYIGSALGPAPSDEGTWGSSSPYIYFWTPAGQYIQWNGLYLYSDKPFRLTVKPIIFGYVPEDTSKVAN